MKIPRKTAAVSLSAGWGEMGALVFHQPSLLDSLLVMEMGPALKCISTGLHVKVLHQAVQAAPAAPGSCITPALQNLRWLHVQVTFAATKQQLQPFQHPHSSPVRHPLQPGARTVPRRKNTQENPAKILK